MRKTSLLCFLVLFVLMFGLASCDLFSQTPTEQTNKIKALSISGSSTHEFFEGDELTLEDLKGIVLTVTYTVDEEQTFDLGDFEELPSGMKIDKLGKVLTSGEVVVTVSYKVGGVTKKATFTLTVGEAMPNELSSLEVDANGIRLEKEETLSLAALKGVKITANYTVEESKVFDLSKLTELPEGLTIEKLGEKLEVGTQNLKVTYKDGEITKEATFSIEVYEEKVPEGTLVLEQIPESKILLEATKALAKAHINIEYQENGLVLTAFVEDNTIITNGTVYTNDSIEIALDKKLRIEGFSDNTLSIVVDAAGQMLVKKLKAQEVLAETTITSEVKMFSFDGKKFAGYKVVINIPYAEVGISKELHDAALMVGMTSMTNNELETETIFADGLGQDYENVHTYALLNEDGSLSQNPYVQLGLVWGNAGSLFKEPTWDINNDDGTENREIHNTASSRDNNIYMHQTDSKEYYAEFKISVRELLNNEKWGKFGISVTKTDGSEGFFFYVDAAAADGIHFNNDAVALGYNTRNAEAWDPNWSVISSLGGNASQYQDGNYVTFGVYRSGSLFALYANGKLIKYVSCGIGENDKAYVGITAFNMLLSVKEYFVEKEDLDAYRPHTEDVDYLFLGDSYIDTAFWYNWGDTYAELSAKNIGVGGTKTGYWQDQLLAVANLYSPKNIVIHIGVNDIDDGNTTGETTWTRLEALLNKYHNKFPEAKIHYITISDNMMFTAKRNDYHTLNNSVKEFAVDKEWLAIVDLAQYIVAENGSTMRWYNNADGLHLNVDGYALLGKLVADSLGLEYDLAGQVGDVAKEGAPLLVHTPGWKVEQEGEETVYHNVGHAFDRIGSEAQFFIKGLYSNAFYAEAKISLEECYASGDEWPKTGLALRTSSGTYYFFMNSSKVTNSERIEGHVHYTDNWGNVMYRAEVLNGNWIDRQIGEYVYLGTPGYDHKFDQSYMTLGIARLGKQLAFYANGTMVGYIENANIGEDEMSAVSVFTFNMNAYAKDLTFTEELNDVYAKMPGHNVVLPQETVNAKVEADKLEAKQGEKVALTVTTKEGISVTAVKVNGVAVELNQETGKYEFLMPGVDANVTIELYGALLVVNDSVKAGLELSKEEPQEGEEVVITVKEGWILKSLLLNGEAMTPEEDGSYKLTLQGYMELTGEVGLPADSIQIDLELDELYGQVYDHFLVAGNRDVSVYARKGANGVYVYVIAHTNNNVTDDPEWWGCHNFEFKINQGAQMFVSNKGDANTKSDNVTTLVRSSVLLEEGNFAGKWEHKYEFFIAKENIKGWTLEGELEFGYAYKAIGEATSHEGQTGYNWQDNYWQTEISAINDRQMEMGKGESHPGCLFITNDGLRINNPKVAPQNGVIDANLEEFANKKSLLLGDDKSQFLLSAYTAADGLYLGMKVYSKAISHDVDNWWENDNIEMQYNGTFFGVVFFDQFVKYSYGKATAVATRSELTEGAMYDVGYRYESVVEYFIPGLGEGDLQFSSNGLGIRQGSWIALLWDGHTAHVNANGLGIERELTLPANTAICTVLSNVEGKVYYQDEIEFELQLAEGVNVLAVKLNGEALEKGEDNKYHFVMPNQNAVVTIEFDSLLDASQISQYVEIDNMNPGLGDKIIVTPKGDFLIKELLNNGNALELKDGKAELTIEGHTVLTGQFGYEADFIQVDLELDELYGTPDHFWITDNRDVAVYARRGYWGVYIYAIVHTNTNVNNNAGEWWNNHSLEFRLNGDGGRQYWISNNGAHSDNINYAKMSTTLLESGDFAGKYEHIYEMFVAKGDITNWNTTNDMELAYVYKAQNEFAKHEDQSSYEWYDQFWSTTVSSAFNRLMNFGSYSPNGETHPGNLFVTNSGLKMIRPVAENGVIDANLEEFADKAGLHYEVDDQNAKAQYDISGYIAEDGLYFGASIYSNKVSNENLTDWWQNDNIEIHLFNSQYDNFPIVLAMYEKFISYRYGNTYAKGIRVELTEDDSMYQLGYRYQTIMEYFIPGIGESDLMIGLNGTGIAGTFREVIWSQGRAHIDANGIRIPRSIELPAKTTMLEVSANKTTAYKGEVIELTLQLAENIEALEVKANDEILTLVDGKYSFAMPDKNVKVTVLLSTPQLVVDENIKKLINLSNDDPQVGEEVTVTAKEGYTIKSITANQKALVAQEGQYKFVFDTYINLDGIILENVDYLFLGDSYMDTAFWYNFADGFGKLDAKNIGVGGTKVEYWDGDRLAELADTYLPKHIIIHIGVNNIDEPNATGEATYQALETMLMNYHDAFEDAEIHYITISDNMMFTQKWDEYHVLNNSVKDLAIDSKWLHIVDIAEEIYVNEDNSTMRWYCIDGLHLGMDGYALLTRMVKESVGIQEGLTGKLGDLNVVGAPNLVYSPGWELLEGGIYHNAGQGFNRVGAESQIFFDGLYDTEFYAEVKISLGDCYANDDWSKTGLALRSDKGTYFYVLNSARAINPTTEGGHVLYNDHFGNMFYRQDVINRNWTGECFKQYFFLHGDFDHYTRDAYITLGIARRGSDLALFSNGIMVAYYPDSLLGEEELTAVSLMTFNMDVYAKDAYYTTDKALVAAKFAQDANIDGNFDEDIYKSEAMNNVIVLGQKSGDRHLEFSGVKGTDGIYFKTVIYSHANTQDSSAWYQNANIEFLFNEQFFVYFNGVGFGRAVGSNNGYYAAVGKSEQVENTDLYRTEIESFIPYSSLGVTAQTENISFKVWGYVFDNDGWFGIMSNGGDQSLAISDLGLRYERNITLPETSSICEVVAQTKARVGDEVELTLNLASGVQVLSVKANGNEVAKDEQSGKYSFIMPDQDVVITVAFDNLLDASLITQWADVSNINPVAGEEITITPKRQWIMKSLKNAGEDVTILEDGTAKITVNAKVVLTGIFKLPADDIETDLVLDTKLYGDPVHFWVEDNRDVTVYAAKGADGIHFYVIAHTNENLTQAVVNDSNNPDNGKITWYVNNNIEFKINQGAQMYISNVDAEGVSQVSGITAYQLQSTKLESGSFAGKWEHVYEFFVPKENITGWNEEGEVEFGYAYKAPAEPARFEGQSFNQWPRDNFWQSTTGALNTRFMNMYEGEQHPGNLFVGLNGLVDKSPKATEVVLDGVLDDNAYEGKASITLGNENAKFIITGFSTDNSLYLAFKVYQKQIAAPTNEWHLNDNIQINYGANFQNLGLSIFDNFITGTWQTKSAMKRVALTEGEMYSAGYKYETVIEYFVPGVAGATLQFGCNGNGFGGWQPLLWDGNWGYVDPSGVYDNVWTGQEVLKQKEGIVLDGIFNETLWTDEVKAKTFTYTAQGSEVGLMARHLPLTNSYVLGVTVKHNHPIEEKSQGDGTEWCHYINAEFRINWDGNKQFAVTNWNHGIAGLAPITFGSATTDNGEEAAYRYTTTFEIAIMASGFKLGDCPLAFGGVWNDGFAWLPYFNWVWTITDTGLVER